MRRSSILIMAIMVIGFGALLFAAQGMLRPLAKDADVAKAVTSLLEERGDLAPGSRVLATRVSASERRLAEQGVGLLLELHPSTEVLQRKEGLRSLATRAAREALLRHPAPNLKWVEVAFLVGKGTAPDGGDRLRTLVALSPEGSLLPPEPALPETLGPPPAPPAAPAEETTEAAEGEDDGPPPEEPAGDDRAEGGDG
ncbi:MAG: hypothetical protein ACYTG6_12035 [Planctomycetota bacterium]|jgi:hypothetical protein